MALYYGLMNHRYSALFIIRNHREGRVQVNRKGSESSIHVKKVTYKQKIKK